MLETIGVAKYSRYIAGRQYEEEDLDFNGAGIIVLCLPILRF